MEHGPFISNSRFDFRAASRKVGAGNELVGMVKEGTVCGNNMVSILPSSVIAFICSEKYVFEDIARC